MPLLSTSARSAIAGLGALVLLSGGMTALHGADAAEPTSGSISAAGDHSTTWTGGPFVAPNVSGNALDAPDCSAPESCDDFRLHVSAPKRYGVRHQLRIKVGWSNPVSDFDIYLLDGKGDSVATAATQADPELILADPKAGDYTVRVVPYAPVPGETYTATASLVRKPDNPPPGTGPAPGFRNYKAPKTLADANNAGEPSIGANFKTGSAMYQAYLSTYKVTWAAGRARWHDVSANAQNGCLVGGTESLDPILFTDSRTGRTFESQLTGVDSFTCWTDDDGKSWNPSTGGGIPSGVDHQTIGGGAYSKDGLAVCRPPATSGRSTTAARTSRPPSARPRTTAAPRSAPASRPTRCRTAAACTAT